MAAGTTKKGEGMDDFMYLESVHGLQPQFIAMDIDEGAGVKTKPITRDSSRIQKRVRHKAKSTMVFPVYKQGRKVGPRTKARK